MEWQQLRKMRQYLRVLPFVCTTICIRDCCKHTTRLCTESPPIRAHADIFPGTARAEEQEPDGALLDQTWPTAVKLARDPDLVLDSADSLKDYRKRKDVAKIDSRFLQSKRGR